MVLLSSACAYMTSTWSCPLVVAAHAEAWWVRAVWFCSASALHRLVLIKRKPNPVVNLINPFALPHSICYMSQILSPKWNKLCFFFSQTFFFFLFVFDVFQRWAWSQKLQSSWIGYGRGFSVSQVTFNALLVLSAKPLIFKSSVLGSSAVGFTGFPARTTITVSPGCKILTEPWGTQLWCHLLGSIGICPS